MDWWPSFDWTKWEGYEPNGRKMNCRTVFGLALILKFSGAGAGQKRLRNHHELILQPNQQQVWLCHSCTFIFAGSMATSRSNIMATVLQFSRESHHWWTAPSHSQLQYSLATKQYRHLSPNICTIQRRNWHSLNLLSCIFTQSPNSKRGFLFFVGGEASHQLAFRSYLGELNLYRPCFGKLRFVTLASQP